VYFGGARVEKERQGVHVAAGGRDNRDEMHARSSARRLLTREVKGLQRRTQNGLIGGTCAGSPSQARAGERARRRPMRRRGSVQGAVRAPPGGRPVAPPRGAENGPGEFFRIRQPTACRSAGKASGSGPASATSVFCFFLDSMRNLAETGATVTKPRTAAPRDRLPIRGVGGGRC